MKFTTELLKKSWAIFKKIWNGNKESRKAYLSSAYKMAIKYYQSLKAHTVTFWKLPKKGKGTEEVEVTTRNVVPVSDLRYTPKTDRKVCDALLWFVDLAKVEADVNPIFCINPFQIL